jgi:hypothetical protein
LTAIDYVLGVSGLTPFELYRDLSGDFHCLESLHGLHGVDRDRLKAFMICDCLAAQKGVNMPAFLKDFGKDFGQVWGKSAYREFRAKAQGLLGRKINRNEIAVLPDGSGVFADSNDRDPVTGLYKLYYLDSL